MKIVNNITLMISEKSPYSLLRKPRPCEKLFFKAKKNFCVRTENREEKQIQRTDEQELKRNKLPVDFSITTFPVISLGPYGGYCPECKKWKIHVGQ
jgi:hypothetical protein